MKKLPLKRVRYGDIFVAFAEWRGNAWFLCECARVPVENHVASLGTRRMSDLIGSVHGLKWQDYQYDVNLCHVCNHVQPDKQFCLPMYGSKFKQYWGWYIKQEGLRRLYDGNQFITPEYVDADYASAYLEYRAVFEEWRNIPDIPSNPEAQIRRRLLEQQFTKLERAVNNMLENAVRERVGVRPVGSRYVSETLLFNLVTELYPNMRILRHSRPDWLNGLELDVFIPELKLAFEYQGVQHYSPVDAWGGAAALARQQQRDATKRNSCALHGIMLVEVRYDERLSAALLRERIDTSSH